MRSMVEGTLATTRPWVTTQVPSPTLRAVPLPASGRN